MIELEDVPELRDPVVIAAFEGWNDAGEAATAAIDHLTEAWDAEPIAALDPEDYYDFQVNRPRGRVRRRPPPDQLADDADPAGDVRRRSTATSSWCRASSRPRAGGPSPSSCWSSPSRVGV